MLILKKQLRTGLKNIVKNYYLNQNKYYLCNMTMKKEQPRKRKIIYIPDDKEKKPEVWTNFKLFCDKKGLVHNTLARNLTFPLKVDGATVYRGYERTKDNPDGLPPTTNDNE